MWFFIVIGIIDIVVFAVALTTHSPVAFAFMGLSIVVTIIGSIYAIGIARAKRVAKNAPPVRDNPKYILDGHEVDSVSLRSNNERDEGNSSASPSYPKEQRVFFAFCRAFEGITGEDVIENCQNNDPLTAALLYTIEDYMLVIRKDEQRECVAQLIFRYLENIYSASWFAVFDRAIEIYGAIIRGVLTARGDWLIQQERADANWFDKLFLCYGDLLRFPKYLDDYQNAPIHISSIQEGIFFVADFVEIKNDLVEYVKRVGEI